MSVPEFVSSSLAFETHWTLPEDLTELTGDADLYPYRNAEYARVHAELLGGDASRAYHQLGGAPQEIQNGLFVTCQLASNGEYCGDGPATFERPRVKELLPGARDWRLLLQIDTDDDGPGWMWDDSGRLYFCMRQDDLVTRTFANAWCVSQSC